MRIIKWILIIILFFPISIYALEYPSLNSKIVEIYDLTDQKIVYEKDSSTVVSIASLTKIATTITAIETIPNLEEEVTITRDILNSVRWDLAKAGLKAGDRVTYRDLLYASMVPSGADATHAIAISSSGSIDAYVSKMNELCLRIGLTNTRFVNVTGLDAEGHYSTADDVRKLLEYSLKNELFREIYTTRNYTLSNGLEVHSTILHYNTSSSNINHILGSKTGYTGDAGYCLSTLSDINSHEFIVIVLNAEVINGLYYHVIDTVNLVDFLLAHYSTQVLIPKDTLVQKIPVRFSKIDEYKLYSSQDITKYLPDDYDKDKIKISYEGLDHLSFLTKEGDSIGKVSYLYDNELLFQDEYVLDKKLEMSFQKLFKAYYVLIIGISLCLLLIITLFIIKKKKNKK